MTKDLLEKGERKTNVTYLFLSKFITDDNIQKI